MEIVVILAVVTFCWLIALTIKANEDEKTDVHARNQIESLRYLTRADYEYLRKDFDALLDHLGMEFKSSSRGLVKKK